jgi:hypothetical protein
MDLLDQPWAREWHSAADSTSEFHPADTCLAEVREHSISPEPSEHASPIASPIDSSWPYDKM